jgi:hypothetical protein
MNRPVPPNRFAPAPISTPEEAQAITTHLNEVMEGLLKLLDHETNLVRAGKIVDASRLEATKAELARLYLADSARLKASAPYLKSKQPKLFEMLRQRHETFQALLQVNLTVLATLHAVSESIMRGVSTEMTRKAAPQVYGSTGRHAAPNTRNPQPVAVSRAL